MTRINIQFLTTKEGLPKAEKKLLLKTIKKHADKASSVLGIPLVNITVYPNSSFVIPETGEGGYASSKDWLQIYIDPTKKKKELNKIIKDMIPATIYHEMNHVARWQYVGYGTSLSEVIVTEGLATVFAEERWEKANTPWSNFSEKELIRLLSIFKKRKKNDDTDYNHGEWFFGIGKLPRWIGYKLGSHIARSFRSKNKNMKWEEIVKMKAEKIIKLSGVELD